MVDRDRGAEIRAALAAQAKAGRRRIRKVVFAGVAVGALVGGGLFAIQNRGAVNPTDEPSVSTPNSVFPSPSGGPSNSRLPRHG